MRAIKYKSSDYLRTPELIAAYLDEALKDSDPRLLMVAIKNVVEATQGMTSLATATGLNRESLYKALSGERAPRVDTLSKILHACGLRLSVSAEKRRRPDISSRILQKLRRRRGARHQQKIPRPGAIT
jgi:probable addiction module antidote protein